MIQRASTLGAKILYILANIAVIPLLHSNIFPYYFHAFYIVSHIFSFPFGMYAFYCFPPIKTSLNIRNKNARAIMPCPFLSFYLAKIVQISCAVCLRIMLGYAKKGDWCCCVYWLAPLQFIASYDSVLYNTIYNTMKYIHNVIRYGNTFKFSISEWEWD